MSSTTTTNAGDPTYRMSLSTGIGIGAGFLILVCVLSFVCVKLHSQANAQQHTGRLSQDQQQQQIETISINPSLDEILVFPQPRLREPGLDELTLQSYPKMVYSEGNYTEGSDGGSTVATTSTAVIESSSCSICLAEYENGQMLRLLPDCRHSFHMPCIDTWLRLRVSCPVCRSSLLPITAFTSRSADPPNSSRPEEGHEQQHHHHRH